MVAALETVSSKIAKCAYFIDVVLCTWVHNPILASLVTVSAALLLLSLLFFLANPSERLANVAVSDYARDLLHNAVNIAFVVRFPAASKKGLAVVSHKWAEASLLLIQIAGCVALLLHSQYSLLYSNIHPVLRGIMWWQMVCPYLIFVLYMCEARLCKNTLDEKHVLTSPSLPPKLLTRSLLVDTNNNLLPIFMAHSFAAVNFNFPVQGSLWTLALYKFGCFSLKFYLINRYVLYELVMVISDMSNLNSYAELYMPVMIGERTKRWYDKVAPHTLTVVIGTSAVLMGLDAGFMAIGFMNR